MSFSKSPSKMLTTRFPCHFVDFFYFFSHFQALERIKILFPYLRYLGGFSLVWQCMDYWHGIMVIQSTHKKYLLPPTCGFHGCCWRFSILVGGYVQEYNEMLLLENS
jgi:hypothetical protein